MNYRMNGHFDLSLDYPVGEHIFIKEELIPKLLEECTLSKLEKKWLQQQVRKWVYTLSDKVFIYDLRDKYLLNADIDHLE